MPAEIQTERLDLDTIRTSDHDFILELLNSKGWLEFIGDRHVRSTEDAIGYIKKIQETPDLKYWIIRVRATAVPVGIVSFIKRSYLEHFDLGFAFLTRYHGKGYAFEAAKRVLQVLQSDHPVILATCLPSNEQSIRLLIKLGFVFTHEKEVEKETVHIFRYDAGQ